ncbi:Gem-associated protein 5 [Nymphon striatum]|nr:Gem-associated protein 5 [Nymphon striatum]
MRGRGLSNSPNWYTSHSCDALDGGLVCFAGKDVLYFLDASKPTNSKFIHSIKFEARVTSVSLNPFSQFQDGKDFHECNISVAIGTENGQVKLWKSSEKVEDSLKFNSDKGNKITSVSWSAANEHDIACCDDSGKIIFYSTSSQDLFSAQFIRSAIITLRCSPHEQGYVAAGYKGGSILIVDYKDGCPKVVYRLRGHDDDVHSIQWCSITSLGKSLHLISGSKDRTVRIWNIHAETSEYCFELPGTNSGKKSDDMNSSRQWLSVHWSKYQPSCIHASNFGGDLLFLDLDDDRNHKMGRWKIFKSAMPHTRSIFTIHSSKLAEDKIISITTSLDRQINIWDLQAHESMSIIPTLGGFVYSLDISPVDNGRLAIGCGDQMLRVWNISSSHDAYQVSMFWQGIRAKILCIAWHPVKEGLIAYGTDEGRVGIYNILQNKPQISKTYHRDSVYNLQWGPEFPSKSDDSSNIKFSLFSCGDGVVYQHDPINFQSDAVNVDKMILNHRNVSKKRTDIAWKPDWSALALGNDDGSIEIFHAASGSLLCEILVHNKLIQCLKWHPMYTSVSGSEKSPHHCWLAASSNNKDIHVFDLNQIFTDKEREEKIVVNSSTVKLVGHTLRVPYISWSPHSEALLVSSSYDNSVQVWDVKKSEPLANFRGHIARVFCAVWNPLDPNEIISGSEDATLQFWKISEQTNKVPPNKSCGAKNKKKKKKDRSHQFRVNSIPNTIERSSPDDPMDVEKICLSHDVESESRNFEIVSESHEQKLDEKTDFIFEHSKETNEIQNVHPDKQANDIFIPHDEQKNLNINFLSNDDHQFHNKDVAGLDQKPDDGEFNKLTSSTKSRKKSSMKSILPVSSSFDNRGKLEVDEDCLFLLQSIYDYKGADNMKNSVPALGTYLEQDDVLHILNDEANYHETNDNIDFKLQLEIWKGNIGGALRYAARHQKLNDWLVSLAPLGSQALWHEMCKLYAEQLLKNGEYRKSVSYFLAIHEIYMAIDVLKKHVSFREAVVLAKSRFPSQCQFVQQLIAEWALYTEKTGQFESSAKCYLSIRQPLKAIQVLSKRSDAYSSRVAAHIAASSNYEDLVAVYVQKCIKDSLLKNDWDLASRICRELSEVRRSGPKGIYNYFFEFQVDEIFVKSHKWLIQSLDKLVLKEESKDIEYQSFSHFFSEMELSNVQKQAFSSSVLKYNDELIPSTNEELCYKISVKLVSRKLMNNEEEADLLFLRVEVASILSREISELSLIEKSLLSFYVVCIMETAISVSDRKLVYKLSEIFFHEDFTYKQLYHHELCAIEELISSKQVESLQTTQNSENSYLNITDNIVSESEIIECKEISSTCASSDNCEDKLSKLSKSDLTDIEKRICCDENNDDDWRLYIFYYSTFKNSNLNLSIIKSRQSLLQERIHNLEENFPMVGIQVAFYLATYFIPDTIDKMCFPDPYLCISSLSSSLVEWMSYEDSAQLIKTKLNHVLEWCKKFAIRKEDSEIVLQINNILLSANDESNDII